MILLSKPEQMYKIIVACPITEKNRVIEVLHETGVIDVVEQGEEKLLAEYEALRRLREEISSLISKTRNIQVQVEITELELRSFEIDKVKAEVNSICTRVRAIESELAEAKKKLEELLFLNSIVSRLPDDTDPRELYYVGRRLSSLIIVGDKASLLQLANRWQEGLTRIFELGEDKVAVIIYSDTSRLKDLMEKARSLNAWTPTDTAIDFISKASSMLELRTSIQQTISELSERVDNLDNTLQEYLKDNVETLGKYLLFIDNLLARYHALSSMKDLKHIAVLSGWVPASKTTMVRDTLERSNIAVYYELQEPGLDEEPPTLMRNKPIIRFYQLITRLYGVPGYREWDPTPIVAYSFSFFFGLMNADFGYAVAGIIATLLILDKFVLDKKSPQYLEFKGVLLVSNVIAALLGLLTGAVFGDLIQRVIGIALPVLIPALTNPLDFIVLSLVVGLIHINIGHVLATIKYAKERKRGEFLVEIGLFIAQLFGIPYILVNVLKMDLPMITRAVSPELLLYGAIVGVVIIIIGSYLTMRVLGLLMWIFQITGVLGDVLSYVRLAGVGLATYYMALIFNMIINMLLSFFSQIHLVIALAVALPLAFITHMIVFVFAQLGAFIHSLRLCMLEFMMKFYDGNGREYNPLRIARRMIISTMQ